MSGMPSFRTYKVIDPVIGDITADTDYGVISGPAQKHTLQLRQTVDQTLRFPSSQIFPVKTP